MWINLAAFQDVGKWYNLNAEMKIIIRYWISTASAAEVGVFLAFFKKDLCCLSPEENGWRQSVGREAK